jgi:hypothetical protein
MLREEVPMRALLVGGTMIGLVAGFVGCASIATPHAPIVTTTRGQRCVHSCRALYDRCASRANELVENGSYWRLANPALDACNDDLGRCYATCPG